jgi:hypothetical protein
MTTLSIVIAVKDAAANLETIVARLCCVSKEIEIIFAVAGEIPSALNNLPAGWRVKSAAANTLIPYLWANGIRIANSDWVALTTAQCIPAADWVPRLFNLDRAGRVGVGGALVNDEAASALNWAIYFLRYSAFTPHGKAGIRDEIAADNAIYNRAAILRYPDLLAGGFWEPSFHARFRAHGDVLDFDPTLIVEHHGLVTARTFALQRFSHGCEYGRARSRGASVWRKLVLCAASPIVPLILWFRIRTNVADDSNYSGKFGMAAPWLFVFILGWSLGEALGYVTSLLQLPFNEAKQLGKGPGLMEK